MRSMHSDSETDTINVDIPKGDVSADLRRFYNVNKSTEMEEGKDSDQLDSEFPFRAVLVGREMRGQHCHPMKHIHTNFSKL